MLDPILTFYRTMFLSAQDEKVLQGVPVGDREGFREPQPTSQMLLLLPIPV